jgi:N-acetylneuraminic acid mutarotase
MYLFGGDGNDESSDTRLNDLWRYDPVTNNWTWLKGSKGPNHTGVYGTRGVAAPNNTPSGRAQAVSWTSRNGKLYVFGGTGYDINDTYIGFLGDLWLYDPATNNWTWLKGSRAGFQTGIYGTQGVANAANTPGARRYAAAWTGADGKLYLFGGSCTWEEYEPLGDYEQLNDLWRYDPVTNNWTWLKGSNVINQSGVYGTQGVAAMANTPGAREQSVFWTGRDGKFYMFGGYGFAESPKKYGMLNDLWRYDPATNNWTWLKGSKLIDQPGVYETAAVNNPGARRKSVSWTSRAGKFYLFGGQGFDCSGGDTYLGDLWCCDSARDAAQGWQLYQ